VLVMMWKRLAVASGCLTGRSLEREHPTPLLPTQ
jgi:hypothetical protein